MSTHTKGPWDVEKIDLDHGIVYSGGSFGAMSGRLIAEVYHGDDDPQGIADAMLIAAAPELLEACKGLLSILKGTDAAHFNDGNIIAAQDAIKKAEGN